MNGAVSNYDLQVDIGKQLLLEYDQEAMIRKFRLEADDEFPPKRMLLWDRNADKFLHFETTFFLQGDLLERLWSKMKQNGVTRYEKS